MKTRISGLSTSLTKCLKDFLPANAIRVRAHDILRLEERGTQTAMYSFDLTYVSEGLKQQKNLVLRIYREGLEEDARKEFELLKALKERDLPVPTAYYFEPNDEIVGRSFMIMEKIAGKSALHSLNDEIEAQVVVDRMAESLAKVHKLDPNCIQNSKVLQEQLELEQRKLLKVRFFIKRTCTGIFFFSPPLQRRFMAAVKRLEEVKPKKTRPVILHMDYEPSNVLVSNGRCIIVDWIMASVGDPAIDVGYAYHVLRITGEMSKADLGEHFVKSYQKYMGQRLVNLQFCKDMAALGLASRYGLLRFEPEPFQVFRGYVDRVFGNFFGRLATSLYVHRMQRFLAAHKQPSTVSNIENIQSYVTQYLERYRYDETN